MKNQQNRDRVSKLENKKNSEYNKQLKSGLFDVEYDLKVNEEDDAIIECRISGNDGLYDIFDKYDLSNSRTLSDEFTDHLLAEASLIPSAYDLELRMHVSNNFTEYNELRLMQAIKREFSFDIKNNNALLRRNNIIGFVMLLGALVSFTVYFLAQEFNIPFLPDFVLIFCWMFLWESCSSFIWDTTDIRKKRYNNMRLFNAKVLFIKDIQEQK